MELQHPWHMARYAMIKGIARERADPRTISAASGISVPQSFGVHIQ